MVLLEGTIYVPPHKLEATQAALVEHIAADILGNQLSPLQAELVSPAAYELQQVRR